jgi:hypothetical protein
MLRKLKWQILAARYNWCQGPVLGRGPADEKHWYTGMNTHPSTLKMQEVHTKRWQVSIKIQCDRCNQEMETASRVLCDFEALKVLWFRQLGHHFLDPAWLCLHSISKVLHFVLSAELMNASAKGCTKDQQKFRGKGHCSAHPKAV